MKNKKVTKTIIIISVIIIFFIIIFFFFLKLNNYLNYENALNGPTIQNLLLTDNTTYSGEINNKCIVGKGKININTENYSITMDGNFDKIDPIKNKIQIGLFKQGKIEIIDKINNNTYIFDGMFENFIFKTGTMTIKRNNTTSIYTGNFLNNRLEGMGTRTIITSYGTNTKTGIFENGIYKEIQTEEDNITLDDL